MSRQIKTIGIVGGLGPESTIEYYRQIIARYREQISDGLFAKPSSAINFAAMAHTVHAHFASSIRNLINDTVVAHSDAPIILAAGEFATAVRPRVLC